MTDTEVGVRVQSGFYDALALPDGERQSWVEAQCAEEPAVATLIMQMLAADGGELPSLADFVQHLLIDTGVPREFGAYRLLEPLGEGGMGVVWLAERQDNRKRVAIKLPLNAGFSRARRERFDLEMSTLAQLNHPNIACLYDAGTLANGAPWFAMEFVAGVSLDRTCASLTDVRDLIRLFRDICEAVRYAHAQSIIHRDLTPTNILVTEELTPKLLDFGIARELDAAHDSSLSSLGPRFVSIDYAAPEWIFSGKAGAYTDIFSLGVLLYLGLTGELPFERGQRRPDANPPRPSAAGKKRFALSRLQRNELDGVCLKAMQSSPAERYETVESLARDLNHFLNGEPVEAHPQSAVYRMRKLVTKHLVAVAITTFTVLLIVGLTAFFTIRLREARNMAVEQANREDRLQQFTLRMFEGYDEDAGPPSNMHVEDLLDRGAKEAENLKEEPAVQADLRDTLGTLFDKIGKFDKADEQLRLALEERRSKLPSEYPSFAQNLIDISLLRADQGREADGKKFVEGALRIIKTQRLAQRLEISANLALARILISSGQNDQAIDVLNRVVAMQSEQSGSSPELSKALIMLAEAHLMRGTFRQAEVYARRSLAVDQRLFSPSHPRIAEDLHYLGEVEEQFGRYHEAEDYERQALDIVQKWYGDRTTNAARMMATVAQTLSFEKRYDEAEALLERALAIQSEVYGPAHEQVAYILNSLATVAVARRDFARAIEFSRRAMEIYRSLFPSTDRRVLFSMGNLATMYLREGQSSQAEPTLRYVVAELSQTLGPDNIDTAVAHVKLGRTLLRENKFAEAKVHTQAGYDVLIKQSPSSVFLPPARTDLAAEDAALKNSQKH